MFARHVSQAEAREVERHLREHLPLVEAPEAIWAAIEAARVPQRPRVQVWRWAFAAAMSVLVASGAYWFLKERVKQPSGDAWDVVWLAGRGAASVGAGQWIVTDAGSRARLEVGTVGSVEVTPNTRVRVVTERPNEHRLALARGEIRATISAPPKLFFVDTASGTAVDLGCEYALSTDDRGFDLLRVTRGWVSLQWKGIESMVPTGASCRTRPKSGPGIPYFEDAPEAFKQALDDFAFGKNPRAMLPVILSQARVSDTLSLWHLISRVDAGDRGRVFDRIAALAPIPGISRELALKLDPQTLTHWKEELAWKW